MVPDTGVAPSFKVKVVALRVNGSMGILNVALIILVRGTLIALFTGSVEMTVGAVEAPVVNIHT